MDLSRLRRGELIAGIGGIVLLFALLFLNWYSVTIETPLADFSIGGSSERGTHRDSLAPWPTS